MAQVLINESTLAAIASAIRGINGGTATYLPSEMASAISTELCKPFKCISDNTVYTKETCPYGTVDFTRYNMTLIRDNFCYRPDGTSSSGYVGCGSGTNSYIADKLIFPHAKKVGGWAFYATNFGEIEIPEVEEIGKSGFCNAGGFKEINIPKVKKIGMFGFNGTDLEKIILPDCLTSIGEKAFYDCIKIKEMVVGSGVTSIPNIWGKESGTYQIQKIYFKGTTPPTVAQYSTCIPRGYSSSAKISYTIIVPPGCTSAYRSALADDTVTITWQEMEVANMPHYNTNGKAVWA